MSIVECRQRVYGYLFYVSFNLAICLIFFLTNYFGENSRTCFTSSIFVNEESESQTE